MSAEREFRLGKKTFFVVPDVSLFPEEYTKSLFLKGLESYFLDDDPYCSLELKIHVLFSLFSDVILFFNIERNVHGIEWPSFIRTLQRQYGTRATIGVMYRKKNNSEETKKLEHLYLRDIGIAGGCVPLEYQKTKNLYLFLNVLIALQANGQRRHLRAVCGPSYKMNFSYFGRIYQCEIRDISISHFSCVFVGCIPEIPLHQKILDMQMNLRGILMKVNGVFCLKRSVDEDLIHVFVFRSGDDHEGLSSDNVIRVNEIIFNTFYAEMGELLKQEFDAARVRWAKERREKAVPDILACARDSAMDPELQQLLALTADL
jgi:hypothetical protein